MMIKNINIAILGAGNMGSSLLGGLIQNGYSSSTITITDPDEKKLHTLQEQFKVNITTQNDEAIKHASLIILAVKPQIMKSVLANLIGTVQTTKPLILSIAAGIRVDSIQHWLGGNLAIVRTMPNTPALIGCGATALYANALVTAEQRLIAENMLNAVGITTWIENENLMDAVTAVSGSGPAYFFLIIEAMQEAAQQLGLTPDVAKILTLQTAFGAAKMALESHDDVATLRKNVTSPGGTTEQALKVLESENIRHTFLRALQAANARGQELAEQLGQGK